MEIKRELIRDFVALGLRLHVALDIANISRSSYYYRRKAGTRGRKTCKSIYCKGEMVPVSVVVEEITELLSKEFIDYGYRKVTADLQEKGYVVGKKLVYRIMRDHQLLHPSKKATGPPWKERALNKPNPQGPLELLEIDFK